MNTQYDNRGQLYIEVANLRVTFVPASNRSPDKDWAGSDVLRIQSYKDDPASTKSLHLGAEIPIADPAAFGQLIAAVCQVYAESCRPSGGAQ